MQWFLLVSFLSFVSFFLSSFFFSFSFTTMAFCKYVHGDLVTEEDLLSINFRAFLFKVGPHFNIVFYQLSKFSLKTGALSKGRESVLLFLRHFCLAQDSLLDLMQQAHLWSILNQKKDQLSVPSLTQGRSTKGKINFSQF